MKQTSSVCISLLCFLWVFTAVSCLHEKAYDCHTRLTVSFSYTFNADQKDLLEQEVQDICMYLFRADGTLYRQENIQVSSLSDHHSLILEVDPGNYHLVAWGNLDTNYYQIFYTQPVRPEMRIGILPDTTGEAGADLPALFYGQTEVDARSLRDTRAQLSLVRNTNQIHVLLEPSQATRTLPDTDVSVRIRASNGTLDFENNTASSEPTLYRPHYGKTLYQEKAYDLASFRVLKLEVGDDTRIGIYQESGVSNEQSLTGLIMQYFPHITSNEDFQRYSDYTFIYRYDAERGVYVLASIAVEGWSEQVSQPGGIR